MLIDIKACKNTPYSQAESARIALSFTLLNIEYGKGLSAKSSYKEAKLHFKFLPVLWFQYKCR